MTQISYSKLGYLGLVKKHNKAAQLWPELQDSSSYSIHSTVLFFRQR